MDFSSQVFGQPVPRHRSDSDDGIDVIPEPDAVPEPDSTSSTSPIKPLNEIQSDNTAAVKEPAPRVKVPSDYVSSTSDQKEVDSAEERELLGELPLNNAPLPISKSCVINLTDIKKHHVTDAPDYIKGALDKFRKMKDAINKSIPEKFIVRYFFNEYVDQNFRGSLDIYSRRFGLAAEHHVMMLERFMVDIQSSTTPRFIHFRSIMNGYSEYSLIQQANKKALEQVNQSPETQHVENAPVSDLSTPILPSAPHSGADTSDTEPATDGIVKPLIAIKTEPSEATPKKKGTARKSCGYGPPGLKYLPNSVSPVRMTPKVSVMKANMLNTVIELDDNSSSGESYESAKVNTFECKTILHP